MGALFGSKPKPPEVVRMPLPEDPQAKMAAERKRREIGARSGRTSTMLSRNASSEAGTSSYSNSLLGQAG